jgi:DNA-binding transcriptional MerR regulator
MEGGLTLEQLADRTGLMPRHIRYLIAQDLVPPPRGGRAHARYGDDHLAAIGRYNTFKRLGFSLSAIRLLMQSTAAVPIEVGSGLSLLVDPALIGSGRDGTELEAQLLAVLRSVLKG